MTEEPMSRAMAAGAVAAGAARLHVELRGAVQGVGFRPFVYRVAHEERLAGWVLNDARGVVLEVEGEAPAIARFRRRLTAEKPAPALVLEVEETAQAPLGERDFRIVASDATAAKSAVILPDLALCADCRRELEDPDDRRFGYPFTNCTNCGPRFTIVDDLPYDRPRTTMRGFAMCPDCRREYEDPGDRRFHAQPNACPACGPRLELVDRDGAPVAAPGDALAAAVAALAAGRILALKGLGGYQLLVDARAESAVARLRERKHRPAKPLALMVPDLGAAHALAHVSGAEAKLLAGREAPIVLLERHSSAALAPSIAPGNPHVGVMLPTTPLHHLLAAATGFPLVCTSGNRSDEPIAIDDGEALERLGGIADLFLRHDRPIARHVDDSVAWLVDGVPQLLRRARGWAPLPVSLAEEGPTIVAVGAHQKDVAALALGRRVFLSQHLGDMETPEARAAFERVILDFARVYEARPEAIAHDLHPDYPTSIWARAAARAEGGLAARCGLPAAALPLVPVQHHHAHLAAALAEHGVEGEALGLTWDGTGYGPDGTVWGGEALVGDAGEFVRFARLRPFRLAGGERAVREPRRVALALLAQLDEGALRGFEVDRRLGFVGSERRLLERLIDDGIASPATSSVGRLFDGVAALVGLPGRVSFEGEAAMRLEFVAEPGYAGTYALPTVETAAPAALAPGQRPTATLLELDWRPLVAAIVADLARGVGAPTIAARFHAALADAALELARRAGLRRVALTGGCFQNRRLTVEVARRLRDERFDVLVHRNVPANDGGIALGQVAVARRRIAAVGARTGG
jgi:hydrogenase maturation protein HypF